MINSISHLKNDSINEGIRINSGQNAKTSDALFESSLDAAKKMLQATRETEHVSAQLTNDFITGKNEDIHSLMIAQEKSSIMLNFTMQVRNQVLDAYREIMRIPV